MRLPSERAEGPITERATRSPLQAARPLRRLVVVAWLVLVVVSACAFCGVSSAGAAVGRPFLSSFGGPVGEPFVDPDAVAVDQADGRVFVGDPEAGVVDVFSSSGVPLAQFGGGSLDALGVAVDEGSGDVYVADRFENAVMVFKPNGSGGYALLSEWLGEALPAQGFGEVTGVAVDNSSGASAGDVYVVDGEDPDIGAGAVDVFKPKPSGLEEALEGELVRVLSAGKMEAPNGVVVSRSSGKVFVADSSKGVVYEFSAAGHLEGKLTGSGSPQGSFRGPEEEEGNVTAIALDETTGDLLVAEAERGVVSELGPSGEWVGWVTGTPVGPFGEPRGIGVGAAGDVYVADVGSEQIDVFGPGVAVPDVVTGKASKLTRTTAILNGAVEDAGKPAKYYFEWGATEALENSTPVTSSAGGEEKMTAALSELHPSTTYFFRLVGENENGTNVGVVNEFTTPTAVEGVETGAVANLAPESATLTGSLKPGGLDTHYYFEWGTTTSYGSKSPEPPVDAGSGSESVKVETGLSGLLANTLYHYRIVAENSLGVTRGVDRKFTTSGPPRIMIEPPTGIGHEQATINAKINPGELATSYRFEYGETTAYGTEVPLGGGSIPAGEAAVAVSASLTGLKLGVTYHYRVVASNSAPPSTFSSDQTFTTVPPAPVDATFATEVAATTATLNTRVNPLGHDTHFYFQYGTESCKVNPAACTNVPAPPGIDIGAGETDQSASQPLSGLAPGTTYFYRVLDSNALGSTEGPERTFTTQTEEPLGFVLPDGRAWEMVTPPVKAAPVEALTKEGGLILSSEDGDSLTYVTYGSVGEGAQGNRSPEVSQILATRGAQSWSSRDIATPSTEAKGVTAGQAPEYQFFTPDLSTALVEPAGKTPAPPLAPGVTQNTMYLRDNATGSYLPLLTVEDTAPGSSYDEGKIKTVGATADLSHVVISSKVPLLGEGSTQGLYEWSAGSLQQLSILPTQVPASGLVQLGYNHVSAGAISSDGSRIEWTNVNPLSQAALGRLYMTDSVRGETVRLDAAQGVSESGSGEARFQTASSDGSRVFFTDWLKLTPDSTAEPASRLPDLYECEMVEQAGKLACKLTDLTVAANAGEHADVTGNVLAATADGSTLFLVTHNVMASNENGNHEAAAPGKNNLYRMHFEGGHWSSVFIGALSSEDSVEWEINGNVSDTAYLTARVSPNGRYFAFMSAASLTGYDNIDQKGGKPDEEVYLYDSATASLRCVSCNPTGARPKGVLDTLLSGEGLGLLVDRRRIWSGEQTGEHWLAGNIPGWTAESVTNAVVQSRYLTDEGRLFFNSPDELVPRAKNGKENVYEFEPAGVGSCESATGGCVALLSSGTSANESAFLEATPDGSNVFFITAAQLLPQDTDGAYDIYDARVCTLESLCESAPAAGEEPCGSESGCRAAQPPVQAPIVPAGSGIPGGAGNLPPPALVKPAGESKGFTSKKPATRAQKLASALKACRKQHSKRKREACEKHARKVYGAHAKKSSKRSAREGTQHLAVRSSKGVSR
jgi:hypothetical protein